MCKTGKRCATSTRASYEAAQTKYAQTVDEYRATAEGSEWADTVGRRMDQTEKDLVEARIQHAMTPAGREEVKQEREAILRTKGASSWSAMEHQGALDRAEGRNEAFAEYQNLIPSGPHDEKQDFSATDGSGQSTTPIEEPVRFCPRQERIAGLRSRPLDNPHRSRQDVHYRLYLGDEGAVEVCVQDFDYPDYDSNRFLTSEAHDSESEAQAALNQLTSSVAQSSEGELMRARKKVLDGRNVTRHAALLLSVMDGTKTR